MAFKVAPVFLLALVLFQVLHHGMLRTVSAPHSSNAIDDGTTSKITNEIHAVMRNISNSLKSIDTSMDAVRNTVQEALNSVGQDLESSSENNPPADSAALR